MTRATTPAVTVRGLGYAYPGGGEALADISFAVAPDECIGVLGPNGAGKSTLLLHLNGLLPDQPPREPRVWIGETPVVSATLGEVRRRVGFLFQDPDDQLVSATVGEDVAFGPEQLGLAGAALDARVAGSLAQVGLAGFEPRLTSRLSQGEKRRVCLAGVLACEPQVLVLDEPTSGLDPRGRRQLKELLRSLPGARIVATHDLELVVDLCSRVLVLDRGRIAIDGPTVPVLSDEPRMLELGLERPHVLLHRHPHR